MRLLVRHTTRYAYERAGFHAVQRLRLTPRDTASQTVIAWRIEAPGMAEAVGYEDGFGNAVHLVSHAEPYSEIVAQGTVETRDTHGVLGSPPGLAHPAVFLRQTPLTALSDEIAMLADGIAAADLLDRLHLLMEAIAGAVAYERQATGASTGAAEAFRLGRGVCQDHAHVFIAAARRMGVPARYVTGYLLTEDEHPSAANHAWGEAFLPTLGWVGFDPANRLCPTETHVRLACGFDAASAAPVTGTRQGGGVEELSVTVTVAQQQQ